jgi:hypothetical protein
MQGPEKAFFTSYPELKHYQDKIFFVYASTHYDHAITRRDMLEIVAEIRGARKVGRNKIIFFNSSETFMPGFLHKAQCIAEIVSEIPKSDLFYSVGAVEGQQFYDELCEKFGWENRFTVLSSHHFEYTIFSHASHNDSLDIPYEIRPKEKLFVCFNKLHRKHRLKLLAEAIRSGWLEKSFYSFEGATKTWFDPDVREGLPLTVKDLKTIETIEDKLPLRLNITADRHNPVDVREDDLEYHQDSYFSIITETIFEPYHPGEQLMGYMDTLFLSEKIYKPFAFKHPFIAVAWHGAIKALRERGYKTFHPYIDESYDDEVDPEKRFQMVVKEIKRLEQFTKEEWIEWQKNIKPIVEYNYKYLLSLTDHRVGLPVDHLFKD